MKPKGISLTVARLPLVAVLGAVLTAVPAFPCQTVISMSPEDLVIGAELILRVTALGVAGSQEQQLQSAGNPDARARFSVAEVLKGTFNAPEIVLPGFLTDMDDWNYFLLEAHPELESNTLRQSFRQRYDGPLVPYRYGRQGMTGGGSCRAMEYRAGGQFLLLLRNSVTGYTLEWASQAPVNEQLRAANDPWVEWVRNQARPNGAVSGRVLQPDGVPAAGIRVTARSVAIDPGAREILGPPIETATDDSGRYRIAVAAGRYFISAEPADGKGMAPTYFPGTANPRRATTVEVAMGGVAREGTDFQLLRTVRIHARVTFRDLRSGSAPLNVRLVSTDGPQAPSYLVSVASDGSFELPNVMAGHYRVYVTERFESVAAAAVIRQRDARLRELPVMFDSKVCAGCVEIAAVSTTPAEITLTDHDLADLDLIVAEGR